jgi:hypothetical protein
VRGTFARDEVTGTFRVQSSLADATGATLVTCDTGVVTYEGGSG